MWLAGWIGGWKGGWVDELVGYGWMKVRMDGWVGG